MRTSCWNSTMPFIVVVVDEVADLMMISGKEIEGAVQRLAQARAAGIHLIAATTFGGRDLTGPIQGQFPTRISFQATSRTILGANRAPSSLLGEGEHALHGGGRCGCVHGPFVSDHEVEDVVRFLKTQGTPEYLDAVTKSRTRTATIPMRA